MSLRTDEPKGFSQPRIPAGNLVQSRHVFDIELHHDVLNWVRKRHGLRLPFSVLGYRFRMKPVYEGVTYYGPSVLDPDDHPDDEALQVLDHKKLQHDAIPWNAYVDAGIGPTSLRVGRQDLSWGETDGFRLLDMIEPVDNRFGFPLIEELDDRRIPLWMARVTSALPLLSFGPFSNAALDAYFVPGDLEGHETPVASAASPFSINAPRPEALGATGAFTKPPKEFDSSRAGIRISTGLFDRVTLSLAHYYTWHDNPYARLMIEAEPGLAGCNPLGGPADVFGCLSDTTLELSIHQVQVSGMSATGVVPYDPISVFRMELAMFWSEAIPQASDLSNDTLIRLVQESIETGEPATTDFRDRNVLRWMVGVDRNFWVRWLNPRTTWFVTGQYFHAHVFDHSDQTLALINPRGSDLEGFPPVLRFDPVYQDEILFTLAANSFYWAGKIQPFPIVAYDPRGVWALVPGVTFFIGSNWVINLKYVNVTGNWHFLGFFKDRDVAYLKVQYNL